MVGGAVAPRALLLISLKLLVAVASSCMWALHIQMCAATGGEYF